MRQTLTICACPSGGFMVYGPAEEATGFRGNLPLVPIKACSYLTQATDFIIDQMDVARAQERVDERVGAAGDKPLHEQVDASRQRLA